MSDGFAVVFSCLKQVDCKQLFNMKMFTLLFMLAVLQSSIGIQVVDIAERHTSVGNHGPALMNFEPRYTFPYGYSDVFIGPPLGTNAIGLNTGIFRAYGFVPHRHQYDGQYVAINRGAVHIAPLIGHVQSVKSTNLEPAPATTW